MINYFIVVYSIIPKSMDHFKSYCTGNLSILNTITPTRWNSVF